MSDEVDSSSKIGTPEETFGAKMRRLEAIRKHAREEEQRIAEAAREAEAIANPAETVRRKRGRPRKDQADSKAEPKECGTQVNYLEASPAVVSNEQTGAATKGISKSESVAEETKGIFVADPPATQSGDRQGDALSEAEASSAVVPGEETVKSPEERLKADNPAEKTDGSLAVNPLEGRSDDQQADIGKSKAKKKKRQCSDAGTRGRKSPAPAPEPASAPVVTKVEGWRDNPTLRIQRELLTPPLLRDEEPANLQQEARPIEGDVEKRIFNPGPRISSTAAVIRDSKQKISWKKENGGSASSSLAVLRAVKDWTQKQVDQVHRELDGRCVGYCVADKMPKMLFVRTAGDKEESKKILENRQRNPTMYNSIGEMQSDMGYTDRLISVLTANM